jgi:hypothetical protein
MSTSIKHVSSIYTRRLFDIQQGKVWCLICKVRKSLKSSQKCPLSALVHEEEFTVEGKREARQGRRYDF